MSTRDDDAVGGRVTLEFLRRYAEDTQRGGALELAHYQALFPAHAELIAEEWAALQSRDEAASEGAASERRVGCYRVFEELGRGGQGVVHRALDERIGRVVALKLLAGVGPGGELPPRARRELEAIARLDHPGLGVVYEAGVDAGQAFLAMRLIQGRSLEAMLAERNAEASHSRSRREQLRADVECVEKVARALHTAHEAGVVHRDVKPANVMIHESGEPVLLDFGLARADDSQLPTLTLGHELLGTTAYMAPERLRGQVAGDRRVDVWSLGVMLYELLTGRRPFEAASVDELSRRIRLEEPTAARRLERGIPRDLSVVLSAALEKNPARRYSTALALAEDLARVRAGRPVHARPVGMLGRARRWALRHPSVAGLVAVLLLAALLGAWAALRFADLAESERVARREAESTLMHRAVEQAELLEISGQLGRRWKMLDALEAAANTRASFSAPLPDGLPSEMRMRELAARALLSPDARRTRRIQEQGLATGRFIDAASKLVTTWVAPDFSVAGLRVLDTATGAELQRMDGMFLLSDSFSVTLDPRAKALIVPRSDAISLWRLADVTHVQQYSLPPELGPPGVSCHWEVAVLPEGTQFVGVAAPRNDPTRPHGWAVWDLPSARVVHAQEAAADLHDWLAVSPDAQRLLVPVGASAMQLVELPIPAEGARVLRNLEAPAPVRAALLGPGEEAEILALTRPRDATRDVLMRLDAEGELLMSRELPTRGAAECGQLRLSPDRRHLAVGAADGEVLLYDALSLELLVRLVPTAAHALNDLGFSPGGDELFTHTENGGSDVWELLLDTELVRTLVPRPSDADHMAVSLDGRLLAAFDAAGEGLQLAWLEGAAESAAESAATDTVEDTSARDSRPERLELPRDVGPLSALAVDARAERVAVLAPARMESERTEVLVWQLPETRPQRQVVDLAGELQGLGFDTDGELRLLLSDPEGAPSWTRLSGEAASSPALEPEHWVLPGPRLDVALLIPQRGVRPPLKLARGPVRWSRAGAGAPRRLDGIDDESFREIHGARFSLDGRRLVASIHDPRADETSSDITRLLCWDVSDGSVLWEHPVDAQVVKATPGLSADGGLVLIPEPDGFALLLDGDTGAPLLRWRAHEDGARLKSLQLLDEGARALTLAADGQLRLWELSSLNERLATLGLAYSSTRSSSSSNN